MAPICSDPRQVVIALNPARRQALFKLVNEITSYMISQLETPEEELGPVSSASTPTNPDGPTTPREDNEGKTENQIMLAEAQKRQQRQRRSEQSSRQAKSIQKAAINHMTEWKKEFMPKLKEILRVPDDDKILAERQKRRDAMDQKKLDIPEDGEYLISFGEIKIDKTEDVASLQSMYHPIPTRLTTIPSEDRREIVSCVLLLLLSTGKYSAHTRVLSLYLASALEVPQSFIMKEETEIAISLMESSTADENQKQAMSAEAETAKRKHENKLGRFWKVGLASVAGAAVIGITGGLAAPVVAGAIGGIMGGVGLGGVASFLGIFWMNGALVGALFGAYGAKMTGEMMDQYAKEVEDFRFIPLKEEWGKDYKSEGKEEQKSRRLRVTIGVNGWLNTEADVTKPWRVIGDDTEVFALRYEMKTLLQLGCALHDLVESFAWKTLSMEIIKRTVLATLLAALWPIQMLSTAANVDNPFSRAHNRSRKAGQILADALINKVQGERPVTLIGYSLGATAIHACLQSLAERHAFGLIDTVVIIGTPAPSAPAHWRTLRTVVSGKIFNVYSENDMVLGFVYRAYSLAMGVAGLQPVKDVEGIENLDLSESVSGHLRYPSLTGEILRKCGFMDVKAGGEIEKDEMIRMKEEGGGDGGGEGDLINFDDEPPKESQKSTESNGKGKLTDDLRGLTISPPGLLSPSQPPEPEPSPQPSDVETPPLPGRPTPVEPEAVPTPPRRPTAPAEEEKPPLPRRTTEPTEEMPPPPRRGTEMMEEKPQLPRRPTELAEMGSFPLPRRPVENVRGKAPVRRPLTPASNDTDDEEFGGIVMVNNDSDSD
ncbi:Fc.00g016810.m01.CDS01 [Cosmosporella sp. VM-42]